MDHERFKERAREGQDAAVLELGGEREGRQLRRFACRDVGVFDECDATREYENALEIAVSLLGLLGWSKETREQGRPQYRRPSEKPEVQFGSIIGKGLILSCEKES